MLNFRLAVSAAWLLAACALPCCADPAPLETQYLPVKLGESEIARTAITAYDKQHDEQTYKVYTDLLDPGTGMPITKGAGGKYTHHRGLFIGWKDTLIGEEDYDTWHMTNCYQQYEKTLDFAPAEGHAGHKIEVLWKDKKDNTPFIREERTVDFSELSDGVYAADFSSTLESLAGTIQLKGDLQHAGMQVRLSDEVSTHEDTTEYVLPEGAKTGEDDAVTGAWWASVNAEVNGKRYSVVHMTPPGNPGGVPVYSIRKYARFGAFFEPSLEEGKSLNLHFRVVWTQEKLDLKACQALYDAFAAEKP